MNKISDNIWEIEINSQKLINITRPNTFYRKVLWILFLIALFNRLYNLGYHSLWIDEQLHAEYAMYINQYGWFPKGFEMNQTFIHILNAIALFFGPKSDFTFRFPVAFLSAFGVPLIYLFAKNLFNKNIGLISSCLFVGSSFLTFWGRVDRAYGLIPILYLIILLSFWKTFNYINSNPKLNWKNIINYPYFVTWIISFIISFFTQIQVFIFFFTAAAFGSIYFIYRFKGNKQNYRDLVAYLFYAGVLILLLLFSPLVEIIMRPLINSFLPQYMSTLILPDYAKLWQIMNGVNWDHTLKHYLDVLTHDFNYFYILGFLGFICAFLLCKSAALMLVTIFFVPFLLMSFILREPNLAKYMAFYYPSFLISGAVSIYYLGNKLLKFIISNKNPKQFVLTRIFAILGVVAILLYTVKISEIKNYITTKSYGNIVDPALSEIFYVPWKEASEYVMYKLRRTDVILHTLPVLPIYFNRNLVKNIPHFWFRQRVLNPKDKTFIPKTDTPTNGYHAASYEGLVRLYNHYPRGFLIAHYYFDNMFTDDRCREFCIQNMKYHFSQNKDGMIRVFSWDRTKKENENNIPKYIFEELGKPYGENSSGTYKLNLNPNLLKTCKSIRIEITHEGINSEDEGILQINNKMFYIPVDSFVTGISQTTFDLDKKFFQEGDNSFILHYNTNNQHDMDDSRGFVIYGIQLTYNK